MSTSKVWDERYSAADYLYGTEPSDFLGERFSVLPAGGETAAPVEGVQGRAFFTAIRVQLAA